MNDQWLWTDNWLRNGISDPEYFRDWYVSVIKENKDPQYVEKLKIGYDGRIDVQERSDGTVPMLVGFFHQIRVPASEDMPNERGPTVSEFYTIIRVLSDLIPDLHFSIQVDPEGLWVEYRVDLGSNL